jgi:hypothetical protein
MRKKKMEWGILETAITMQGSSHHSKALFNYFMDLHSILIFPYRSLVVLKRIKIISYRPLR